MNFVVESGDGKGFTTKIGSDGSMNAAVTNTVNTVVTNTIDASVVNTIDANVVNTIDTLPAQGSVTRSTPSISASGNTVAASNSNRRQIQIQNLDLSAAVFIRLEASASATITDLRIAPGQTYSFPPGVSYTDEINGKGDGATVQLIVIEFNG